MVYLPLKPASGDNLSVSQGDIQQNFQTANTVMSINHYPFDDVTANKGKHKFVDMPVGALPTIGSGDGGLYTKAVTAISQLFYTQDASGNEYQLSRVIPASFATFSTNPGWTFLPGGLLMQYGSKLANTGSPNGSVTFPVAFTATPYSVQITVLENSNSRTLSHVNTLTNAGFTCYIQDSGGSSIANTFYWIAVGK